jgi:hypothetical protein
LVQHNNTDKGRQGEFLAAYILETYGVEVHHVDRSGSDLWCRVNDARWHTNPDLAQTVDTLAGHGGRAALDRIWPGLPELTPDEYERLKFADRLDAYMWAKHHAPHVLDPDSTVKEYLTVQTDDPSSCCQSDPLLHFLPLLY